MPLHHVTYGWCGITLVRAPSVVITLKEIYFGNCRSLKLLRHTDISHISIRALVVAFVCSLCDFLPSLLLQFSHNSLSSSGPVGDCSYCSCAGTYLCVAHP